MIDVVRNFLKKHELARKDKVFALGFSGGYDSMCLLDILRQLSAEYGFKIIALHLNHNWRPHEAVTEEENCKRYCEQYGLKFISETLDEESKKTETCAREYRQIFFKKYYELLNADGLFLAHTKSDNAETLLFRIAYGTGVKGLCGISENNVINECKIYRPLLSFSRKEIEDYCNENNLSPNHDSSNENTDYTRNFIRAKIVPLMKEINPDFENSVSNLSGIAHSEQKIINEYLELLEKKVKNDEKYLTNEFLKLSTDVQKKFILKLLTENFIDYDSKKIDEIVNFITENKNSKCGKTLSLGQNLWLFCSCTEFYLLHKSDKNLDEVQIEKEGEYRFGTKLLSIRKCVSDEIVNFPKETEPLAYSAQLNFPLTIRHRKEGDIISPFGMKGSMKLKKFFINKNVPKHLRDDIILLCKGNEVLWAIGCCLSEKLRVQNRQYYRIEVKND